MESRQHWVPFTLPWDDSPIDISQVFEREAPAGKHGFLTIQGDKMVWEDGTEARFWGTCFNSGANFPPKPYAEKIAERLAKFGVNMMRTHQMDAEWATPNLFEFNRAKPSPDTRSFDPESMDRLDYLFHCLKQAGVYIYLDILTYRKFKPGDGVDAVDEVPWGHNPYAYFDPRQIELQKEFARNLFCHINPYTKLAYKDDPAICLSELTNEADLFLFKVTLEPYRTRLEEIYRRWAEERNLPVPAEKVDFTQKSRQLGDFFVWIQETFYRDMTAYLRDIGVKIPITGTNYSVGVGIYQSNLMTDFMDSHCYWNFPRWEFPDGTDIRPMVGEVATTFDTLSYFRALDKPFFVSEWDHAWPAPYRAESPIWYAAVGALQGWSGFTIHTYRYGYQPQDYMGATTINGVPYRMHFDTFNDPSKFGLFPHAALLFRRGDLREAQHRVAVQIADDTDDWQWAFPNAFPGLQLLSEKHRVGMVVPGQPFEADEVVPATQAPDTSAGEVASETGEMWRSWTKRYGTIDSPRTKAAYGFLGEAGVIALNGLELEVRTDFATIALSSLNDQPLDETDIILLTAVGRSDNAGAKYSDDGKRQLDRGHAPVIIEPIEATVRLKTARPNLKVWVIADNKEAVTPLPTKYEDGVLTFDIGAQPFYNRSTMYYIIRI